MLARRFALPPVHEASYEPRQIPNAPRDMEGTAIFRPPRELWLTMLGEMVQMVNEAVRRRAASARDASKPLSLEYMADRLDVDDPLFGYMAVTKTEGWLQGFVTATTFTTWHHDFRWDSTNPALDLYDHVGDDDAARERAPPAVDADGTLSAELQAELRAGDPEDQGVVWPRVAELSLLGALGCGRWLVQLIIDEMEKPDSPYAYIVTQATDNSIPFYERMGFVRVGAVTAKRTEAAAAVAAEDDGDDTWQPVKGSGGGTSSAGTKKRKATAAPPKPAFVCSPHEWHRTESGDETVAAVAERMGVPVHDLVFMNAHKYPKLKADSVLRKDTKLRVPRLPSATDVLAEATASHDQYHAVPEDMPFKKAAEALGMDPQRLLRINQRRPELKGLQLSSELFGGTRLQTKAAEYEFDEYCHWTFADDDPAKGEPSYMMARRLKPAAERGPPAPTSTLARSEALLIDARPPVLPSGKRAAFIQVGSSCTCHTPHATRHMPHATCHMTHDT